MKADPLFDPQWFREDFPILRREVRGKPLIYFDNAATTQKPRQVIQAIVDFYENHNANIHRGVHALSDEATQAVDDARRKIAAFIHAPLPESVIFTRNATESINLVARAWAAKFLKASDEILLTEMEHHSNLVPWQMLAKEKGLRLRFIPVTPEGTLEPEAFQRVATPRTKLVAFTAVSNALGTINPVLKILALAREIGAKTLVDGSQWVPHLETDVAAWDCDFLAFSAHKMLGPTGLGVLYAKPEILEAMDPYLGGGDMISQVFLERFTPNVLPHKFEAGTPHIAGAVAFGAALDYLKKIGFKSLREHEISLTEKALEIVREMPEAVIYGPQDPRQRCGVVSFTIAGLHPHDLATALDLDGIAIRAGHHCCQPLMRKMGLAGTARASFYLYNTLDEIEALGPALRKSVDFFRNKVAPFQNDKEGAMPSMINIRKGMAG